MSDDFDDMEAYANKILGRPGDGFVWAACHTCRTTGFYTQMPERICDECNGRGFNTCKKEVAVKPEKPIKILRGNDTLYLSYELPVFKKVKIAGNYYYFAYTQDGNPLEKVIKGFDPYDKYNDKFLGDFTPNEFIEKFGTGAFCEYSLEMKKYIFEEEDKVYKLRCGHCKSIFSLDEEDKEKLVITCPSCESLVQNHVGVEIERRKIDALPRASWDKNIIHPSFLKPCPFCGTEATEKWQGVVWRAEWYNKDGFFLLSDVRCNCCGTTFEWSDESSKSEDILKHYNERKKS